MRNSGVFDGLLIECPQCGRYELKGAQAISASFQWAPELRQALSCAARQAAEAEQPLQITGGNAAEFAEPHMHTRVSDNRDRLLREAAKRSGRPHIGAPFSLTNDFTLIDCYSQEEFVWYIEWLKKQELVFQTSAGPTAAQLTLSMEGWNRVQPLSRPGGIPGRCFVAMWFSDETRAAYEEGIELAVSKAGFKPIRIDRKEHNNEIPDEIIAEIRNSQFMVADFTGQRAGVYYEAGFAMGLGRPVVWCCRKDEIRKLHFDTNHKNHIDWQTPQDLKERLYTRIRMTVLEQG
jgi:hypothetical protein